MNEIILELTKLVESSKDIKTISEFSLLTYKISLFLEKIDEKILPALYSSTNIHIDLVENIFTNPNFNDALSRVMKNNSTNKLVNDGQLVCIALKLSTFIIGHALQHTKKETAEYICKRFYGILITLSNRENKQFKIEYICTTLLDCLLSKEYYYKTKSPFFLDLTKFFENIKTSNGLMYSMIMIIKRTDSVKNAFKKFLTYKKACECDGSEKKFSLTAGLESINTAAKQELFLRKIIPNEKIKYFDNFIESFNYRKNESTAFYIIEIMTNGFSFQEGKTFFEVIKSKLETIDAIQKDIDKNVKDKLSVYNKEVNAEDSSWSNKIYLISIKTLSVLNTIQNAKDEAWINNVFIYEYYHWVTEVHQILNKYDIEDDWEKIKDLVDQENSTVEWKSTFLTPIQQEFNEKTETKLEKKLLHLIAENILGMINTDGGTILVGLVENPGIIVRKDILDNLVHKNNIAFFNVNYELEKKSQTSDAIKRRIQDLLFADTLQTTEKFNDLWSMESLEIKDNYKIATIYKITVNKSSKYIFNTKKEGGIFWVTLTKRADGRTFIVDPREYVQ